MGGKVYPLQPTDWQNSYRLNFFYADAELYLYLHEYVEYTNTGFNWSVYFLTNFTLSFQSYGNLSHEN